MTVLVAGLITDTVLLLVGDVDVAGLGAGGADRHPDRVGADGDGGDDGVGGGVDHRHRRRAFVGDVDVAGSGRWG